MAEILLIRPGADPARWHWAVFRAENGDVLRGGRDVPEVFRGEAAGRETWLLLPGGDVRLEWIDPPPAKGAEMQAAAAYLLEEQLCERVEDLHFALGGRDAGGRMPVAVVRSALLRSWLDALGEQGIRPVFSTSEVLAVPVGPGWPSVLVTPDAVLVRTGTHTGFALDPALAAEVVDSLPAIPAGAPLPILLVEGAELPGSILSSLREKGFEPRIEARSETCMALFAGILSAHRPSVNLLQADFIDRKDGGLDRRWWPAIALVLSAFVVHVGWSWWDLHAMEKQSTALEAASEALFRQAFPDVRRIVDVRAQADQQLQALKDQRGSRSEFLDLFGAVAGRLNATPSIELTGFSFDDGSLDLQMRAADVGAVDALAGQLGAQHLSAKIISTESRDGKVEARLRVGRIES